MRSSFLAMLHIIPSSTSKYTVDTTSGMQGKTAQISSGMHTVERNRAVERSVSPADVPQIGGVMFTKRTTFLKATPFRRSD